MRRYTRISIHGESIKFFFCSNKHLQSFCKKDVAVVLFGYYAKSEFFCFISRMMNSTVTKTRGSKTCVRANFFAERVINHWNSLPDRLKL